MAGREEEKMKGKGKQIIWILFSWQWLDVAPQEQTKLSKKNPKVNDT
ncbi:MAG: hypothetical protein V4708_09995 [Bacteroidota bacterium]